MLRVLRFSTHRPLTAEEARDALAIAREAAAATERMPGVKSCTSYADPEVLVLAAECDCCNAAEEALEDSGVQAVLSRLYARYGFMMCDDEFTLEPDQAFRLAHA